MQKFRNITVCVTPKVYREARRFAAENDTSVSFTASWFPARLKTPMRSSRTLAESIACRNAITFRLRANSSQIPLNKEVVSQISAFRENAFFSCKTVSPRPTHRKAKSYRMKIGAVTVPVQLSDCQPHPNPKKIQRLLAPENPVTVPVSL